MKITRKDLQGKTVVQGHDGSLQGVLRMLDKIGYNAGVYGWNWDCWKVGRYYVVSGYRSFPHVDIVIPYEISKRYNAKYPASGKEAEKIMLKLIEKAKSAK